MGNPLAQDLAHVLARTSKVWEELDGAKIFLTGGTGFFGCWLLESFCFACERLGVNASMTVLTRSAKAFQAKAPHLASHAAVTLVEGDVRSFHLPGARFSHVIHAAADATPELCRERPLLVWDTIVDGTRRVLDFAVSAGARRVLFTSSGAVYGQQPGDMERVPESYSGSADSTDPANVYGEGKRAAELLCSVYAREHDLQCLTARCFAFAGPYLPLNAHFAIGNFIRDRAAGGPIKVNGDGRAVRSYLYAADLAIWLWTILVEGQPGRAYNVGSEQAITIAQLAAAVSQAFEPHVAVRMSGLNNAQASRYVPATDRARQELNLQQWVPLEEAIRRTAAFTSTRLPKGDQV